jgi:hypothetical protein
MSKPLTLDLLRGWLEEAYEALSMMDTEDGARGVRQAIAEIEADIKKLEPLKLSLPQYKQWEPPF